MARCRVLLNCYFKSGMEDKGLKILDGIENALMKSGCKKIDLFQDMDNGSHYYYAADWNSLEEAKKAQCEWDKKAAELPSCCTNTPKREFYLLKTSK